ncbi:MAG: fimbrial protein [Desulfuromonas sp.]|nr:MAG: fimbrial protein [Desulfuromonas sp.]
MIRINLLPVRAAQKKEKLISQIVILVGSIVLVGLACSAVQGLLGGKISDAEQKISTTKNEIRRLDKKIGEVDKIKQLTADLDSKKKVLEDLDAGRTGPVKWLDELSSVIPDKVWINSLQVANGKVSLNGTGTTEEVIAVFMRDLEASPYYVGVDLGAVKRGKQGNSFDLTCRLESPK